MDWLFPPTCPGCGVPVGRVEFCGPCLGAAVREEFRLDGGHRAVACGRYEGPLRRALLAYKLAGKRALGPALVQLMALAYQAAPPLEGLPVVVEVPTAASRGRYRGYNPAGLLADELSRRLELPRQSLLECLGERPEQKWLSSAGRRGNRLEAFRSRGRISGPCLLVDDVVTTGTTAGRCIQLLEQAGANPVAVLAVARSIRRAA